MPGEQLAVIEANRAELARAMANLNAVIVAAGLGAREGLTRVAVEVNGAIKKKLSEPGTGAVYLRGKNRDIEHRASAPGEPPAVDTGQYRASWKWRAGEENGEPFSEVFTSQARGPWLEFGTSRMQARPHLRPVVHEYRQKINKIIAAAILRHEQQAIHGLRAGFFKGFGGLG